jgi:hypothetical protein
MDEAFWLPLVDEPIGDIVASVQAEDTQVTALITSPRRQLAFRTFAYIRVGLVLGQLLVDTDTDPDSAETWVEQVLADPNNMKKIADEIRVVAHEVASDPKLSDDEPVGPDDAARERFRAFARKSLADAGIE